MTYTAITAENAADFPVGSTVEFNYGAMHGTERGMITGHHSGQWGTHLTAVTDNGSVKTISGFTTVGIGAYLIERATPRVNPSSPWYRPDA